VKVIKEPDFTAAQVLIVALSGDIPVRVLTSAAMLASLNEGLSEADIDKLLKEVYQDVMVLVEKVKAVTKAICDGSGQVMDGYQPSMCQPCEFLSTCDEPAAIKERVRQRVMAGALAEAEARAQAPERPSERVMREDAEARAQKDGH